MIVVSDLVDGCAENEADADGVEVVHGSCPVCGEKEEPRSKSRKSSCVIESCTGVYSTFARFPEWGACYCSLRHKNLTVGDVQAASPPPNHDRVHYVTNRIIHRMLIESVKKQQSRSYAKSNTSTMPCLSPMASRPTVSSKAVDTMVYCRFTTSLISHRRE